MSTVMGVGTRYLGFSFRRPDDTHEATEWFVLLYMPIIPLRRQTLLVGETDQEFDILAPMSRAIRRGDHRWRI